MINKSRENNIITWTMTSDKSDRTNFIAEFEFFEENEKVWLNNCAVDEDYRKKGVGETIIVAAIETFGAVYFSSAEKGGTQKTSN